ncbi:unnamed protein product [Rotaria sp. Silwood2]|nr:unnamed protein product [Rotaria sp. Silwood2]CAF4185167.1 unnamed protein product [Rotaria sp. Silwood2]
MKYSSIILNQFVLSKNIIGTATVHVKLGVSCTRSEGFYGRTTSYFLSSPEPSLTILDLVVGYLFIDSLLASSLECFYNTSCIQILIKWRSFDSYNAPVDSRVINVISLDSTVDSCFSPDTKSDKIVSQLFIENWANSTNFSFYYNQCTYAYEERFNRAYAIATILGIVDGLSIALRTVILPIVKLLREIYNHCRRHQQHVTQECFVEKEMFHANQLHNVFDTYWNVAVSYPNDNYIMSTCSTSLLSSYNKTELLSD